MAERGNQGNERIVRDTLLTPFDIRPVAAQPASMGQRVQLLHCGLPSLSQRILRQSPAGKRFAGIFPA
jgi:hypothetical protein